MLCENCGADFDRSEPKCPYCGTLNPHGAENKYLEKLEDILENTEDLMEIPEETYARELKHHGRLVMKVCLIVTAVCLIFGGILWYNDQHYERMYQKSVRQTIAFQEEYFPKLNELYAAGDDFAVNEYILTLLPLDGSNAIYDWKHYSYYRCFQLYLEVMTCKEEADSENPDESLVLWTLVSSFECLFENYIDPESITDAEEEKVTSFRMEILAFCQSYLTLSEEDLHQAYKECLNEYGHLDYDLCDKYSKELIKTLR